MDGDEFFRIAKFLRERTEENNDSGRRGWRESAVLVLFHPYRGGGDGDLVMIRRAHNERDPHGGQLGFPGGMMEKEDGNDPVATALREAWEEIGLCASSMKVQGRMGRIVTGTGFSIVPVLGTLDANFEEAWRINEDEVAEVIRVRWSDFLREGCCLSHERHGEKKWKKMSAYWIDSGLVWGASARILEHLFWAEKTLHKGM